VVVEVRRGESLSYYVHDRAINIFPLSGGAGVWTKPYLPAEAVHSRVANQPNIYSPGVHYIYSLLFSRWPLVGIWEVAMGPHV
jgi:hypothetical protein